MYKKGRISEGWAKAIAAAMVIGAIVVPVLAVNAQSTDNSNDIIWGGCYSKQACLNDMQNGDGHNGGANIMAVYNHFGVGQGNFSADSEVPVTVHKDGTVVIKQAFGTWKSGDVVADNAWSVGRQNIAGSRTVTIAGSNGKNITVYQRSTQISFASASIDGWADMSGNTFHSFVLDACGNVGGGSPKPSPKPSPSPTPTPTPTHTPSPTPTPSTKPTPCGCTVSPTPTPIPTVMPTPTPTPVPSTPPSPTPSATPAPENFACVSLLVSQDQSNLSLFHFTINSNVSNGAQVTGHIFRFSDQGFVANQTDANTDTFSRTLPAGEITAQGQVETSAGTSDVSQACTVTVNVPAAAATPSPTPSPTGQVLGAAATPLPATGPEAAFGGVAGLTAIGMAGRAYLRSRKTLLDSLRGKNRK